jgi:HlyD family secretion protein
MAWTLCVLLAASTSVLGYLFVKSRGEQAIATDEKTRAAKQAEAPEEPPSAAVENDIKLEAKGYIIPVHQILISPQVSGKLVKLDVYEGKAVKKGDVLALIEDTDYLADVKRAEAALALAKQARRELDKPGRPEEIVEANAELEEAKAQLRYLYDTWSRSKRLLETRSIPQEQYDEARSKYEAMARRIDKLDAALTLMRIPARDERIQMADADVQRAEADLIKARWRLENCKIVAPTDGTILKKNAEENNIVNPIAFNGSYSICEMADLSDLEVDLSIQERDIANVFVMQKCRVRAEAYPDRVYEGYVSRLMPIGDRAKGAIPVRVKLTVPREEEGVYLKPEMGALVSFLKDKSAVR